MYNKNVGPITLHPLVMYKLWFGLQSTVWLGHDTITNMGNLVVITFVGMSVSSVIIQPTYVGLVSLYVGISVLKGLKLTCMNESGPVLLMP